MIKRCPPGPEISSSNSKDVAALVDKITYSSQAWNAFHRGDTLLLVENVTDEHSSSVS